MPATPASANTAAAANTAAINGTHNICKIRQFLWIYSSLGQSSNSDLL